MDDELDALMIDVRANTDGFRADIERMRASFDRTLVDGFADAGGVLERGLLSAVRRGTLGFDDLKRAAMQAMNEIAGQALQLGLDRLLGGIGGKSGAGSIAGLLTGLASAALGQPGRALGGDVAPGAAYLVGERGPELFVPTSAGRIEANGSGSTPRDVRVAINLNAPRGEASPVALRRSARQVAAQLRRAVAE